MKKYFFHLLLIIFLIPVVRNGYPVNIDSSEYQKCSLFIEAESGSFSELKILNDSTASANKYLSIKNKGYIKWNVDIKREGYYHLSIQYRSPEGEKEQLLIINSLKIPVGFALSNQWTEFTKDIHLLSGNNAIELLPNWGNLDIDFIKLVKSYPDPVISPRQNIFYKDFPVDLFIKINLYEDSLKSITCEGNEISFTVSVFPYVQDAFIIKMNKESILDLPTGKHIIKLNLISGAFINYHLQVLKKREPTGLTIIAPYVEHGSSVLFILPDRKIMLVDCGKSWIRDSIIIPMLYRNGIKKINYFFITHYHEDHDSGDKGEKMKTIFHVDNFFDYKSFSAGDTFSISGMNFKVLNSFQDGLDENTRSLSFKMEFKGFIYVHGGDTYAINQQKILQNFPDDIEADVFYANHHFHGSVDVDYLKKVNPSIVLLQAQQAIYARSAYMHSFLDEVVEYYKIYNKKFIEILPNLEVGTVVIRVNNKNDWTYETINENEQIIPFIN